MRRQFRKRNVNGSVPKRVSPGYSSIAESLNGSVPAIRQLPFDTCSGGRDSGDGMASKLRIQYPGAVYHVMNRGDRRESIFHDKDDRQRFIETLGEVCGKTGWQVHAYCLMPNHFHLVLETPHPNLVAGMQWFLGTYTKKGSGLNIDIFSRFVQCSPVCHESCDWNMPGRFTM